MSGMMPVEEQLPMDLVNHTPQSIPLTDVLSVKSLAICQSYEYTDANNFFDVIPDEIFSNKFFLSKVALISVI